MFSSHDQPRTFQDYHIPDNAFVKHPVLVGHITPTSDGVNLMVDLHAQLFRSRPYGICESAVRPVGNDDDIHVAPLVVFASRTASVERHGNQFLVRFQQRFDELRRLQISQHPELFKRARHRIVREGVELGPGQFLAIEKRSNFQGSQRPACRERADVQFCREFFHIYLPGRVAQEELYDAPISIFSEAVEHYAPI